LPTTKSVGYLVNPTNRAFAESEARDMKVAAQTLGVNLLIVNVTDPTGFDSAFAAIMGERPGGIVISGESLFLGNPARLVALAAQYQVPTVYPIREATAAGGLVSYSAIGERRRGDRMRRRDFISLLSVIAAYAFPAIAQSKAIPRIAIIGRYWRSNLLVFSFEPRCQGDRGSQK
jgi:hypothetical protein